MSTEAALVIRPATPADVPTLIELHRRSLRGLGRDHYDRAALESTIAAGTLPPELLRFGRYRVALRHGRIVGGGGWLEGGPLPLSSRPANAADRAGTAVIRAVYVDPDHAREGVGRALMEAVEADAKAAGRDRTELLASRMAVRFFSRLGYRMGGPLSVATADDRLIEVFAMDKALAAARARPRLALGRMAARPFPGFAAAA